MALKKKPVTGMKDILPKEMEIRNYVMNMIRETYGKFGFSAIETPCVEHIENLTSKQGGDNEKLIFKILKRGEKLNLETAASEADLTDSGLRYDLTLPLGDYDKTHKVLILTTQVTYEGSDVGIYEVGKRVKNRFRFLEAHDMTIEAVVTKVMWLLAQNCENFDQLQQRFYRQINFDTFYH